MSTKGPAAGFFFLITKTLQQRELFAVMFWGAKIKPPAVSLQKPQAVIVAGTCGNRTRWRRGVGGTPFKTTAQLQEKTENPIPLKLYFCSLGK